ncbi:MAG: adenylate/guanylate cyclase domain-containing protein, partial [Actinomycetota bacterium]|nr:adenylate/guanylate cyclase domain-containing protein [Actinomycetota bacterium]
IEWQGFRTFSGRQPTMLTTLLFTDLVESTSTVARLGDAAWRDVLARHYASIRAELDRSGGREVKTTGDGMLALFDVPASAVRCAAAIRDAANRQDLHIRAGIHVGEVQVVGDNVEGLAVHEAARVMAAAGMDELLVSESTRALAVAAGVTFEDRGVHTLKGIPGDRRLFAAVER